MRKKYPDWKKFSVKKLDDVGFKQTSTLSESNIDLTLSIKKMKDELIKLLKDYVNNFEKNTDNKKKELIKKIKKITKDDTILYYKKQIKDDNKELFKKNTK